MIEEARRVLRGRLAPEIPIDIEKVLETPDTASGTGTAITLVAATDTGCLFGATQFKVLRGGWALAGGACWGLGRLGRAEGHSTDPRTCGGPMTKDSCSTQHIGGPRERHKARERLRARGRALREGGGMISCGDCFAEGGFPRGGIPPPPPRESQS